MKASVESRIVSSPIKGPAYYRRLLSNQPHPLKALDALATIVPFRRGQEICSQCRPLENWYFLISGSARRCAMRCDGRRQIVDLVLPGDFFGLAFGGESDVTIEAAVEGTVVASHPFRRIEMLADSDPNIAKEIRHIAFTALARMQAQLLILGRITALEKVGSFILELAARRSNGNSSRVALPVSRYDIADYLGVSVETVSRALSGLKRRGAIKLLGTRTISIIHRDLLEDGERDLRENDRCWARREGAAAMPLVQ